MFKKGDKVVVVDDGGNGRSYIGQELTIKQFDGDCFYFEEVDFCLLSFRLKLVEQPTNLSNKKINVKRYADENNITLEQAHKEIQGWLFENGCNWGCGNKSVVCSYSTNILIDEKGLFCDSGMNEILFKKYSFEELTFTTERSVKLTPVLVEPLIETIELNGKKYDKSELEKALQHIKPLEE